MTNRAIRNAGTGRHPDQTDVNRIVACACALPSIAFVAAHLPNNGERVVKLNDVRKAEIGIHVIDFKLISSSSHQSGGRCGDVDGIRPRPTEHVIFIGVRRFGKLPFCIGNGDSARRQIQVGIPVFWCLLPMRSAIRTGAVIPLNIPSLVKTDGQEGGTLLELELGIIITS